MDPFDKPAGLFSLNASCRLTLLADALPKLSVWIAIVPLALTSSAYDLNLGSSVTSIMLKNATIMLPAKCFKDDFNLLQNKDIRCDLDEGFGIFWRFLSQATCILARSLHLFE